MPPGNGPISSRSKLPPPLRWQCRGRFGRMAGPPKNQPGGPAGALSPALGAARTEETSMPSRIHIEKSGDKVTLHAPEHPLLAERATELGGHPHGKAWQFPGRDEARVHKLARQLFGTD